MNVKGTLWVPFSIVLDELFACLARFFYISYMADDSFLLVQAQGVFYMT